MKRAFAVALSIALGIAVCLPSSAHAVTSKEKKAEAEALAASIDDLQTRLNAANSEYNRATDAYDSAVAAVKEAQSRLDAAEARTQELQDRLSKRAKNIYKSGSAASFLDVIFGSSTFDAFVTLWDAMQSVAENDAAMVDEARAVQAEAKAAEEELKSKQDVALSEMESARAAQSEIRSSKLNMQAELAKVTKDIAILQKKEEEERIAAEEAARRAAIEASIVIPSTVAEGWVHPCPKFTYVSCEFGYSEFHKAYHNGTDLAANSGAQILAAYPGTVSYVGWYGGGGKTVIVNHGEGVRSLYMHMSQTGAKVGQQVEAGQVIGYVGSTGYSTGPHLHFQVEVNGTPMNARNFVSF